MKIYKEHLPYFCRHLDIKVHMTMEKAKSGMCCFKLIELSLIYYY